MDPYRSCPEQVLWFLGFQGLWRISGRSGSVIRGAQVCVAVLLKGCHNNENNSKDSVSYMHL